MTRRLDPQDRIRELGDASVPFHFDVHAIIYSDNAPQMEYEFHQNFKDRRINLVNQRKEFFRLSLDDIEAFVKQHANAEIVFTKLAEAREYRETMSLSKKLTLLATESVKPIHYLNNYCDFVPSQASLGQQPLQQSESDGRTLRAMAIKEIDSRVFRLLRSVISNPYGSARYWQPSQRRTLRYFDA
ncbi:MAG: GIY-YIG nuclease family protein [Bacteroidota bacterium]